MSKNMKLIMENWRKKTLVRENESSWNQSPDHDFESSKIGLIVFDEKHTKIKYPSKNEPNHGLTSHAIKHADEFGDKWYIDFHSKIIDLINQNKPVFIKAPKAKSFELVNKEKLDLIKSNDKEYRKTLQGKGINLDALRNILTNPEQMKNTAKKTMDFYWDGVDKGVVKDLMSSTISKYHSDAVNRLKQCKQTYTGPRTSPNHGPKTWCTDDDALSISINDKISTTYKEKNPKKAIDRDYGMKAIRDLYQNEPEEILKIKQKLKI